MLNGGRPPIFQETPLRRVKRSVGDAVAGHDPQCFSQENQSWEHQADGHRWERNPRVWKILRVDNEHLKTFQSDSVLGGSSH